MPEEFLARKCRFFGKQGLRVRAALKLHRKAGLWERCRGIKQWRNVSEHCLVEAARVGVLADWLGLPWETNRKLALAAAAHDFFKRREHETGARSWSELERASAAAARCMCEAGLDEEIVRLVDSVGHGSLEATEALLAKPRLSEMDVARLVMHYVDDYTIGSAWVAPVEILPDGRRINDLDRRIDRNAANPRYATLDAEGRVRLGGETTFAVQRRVGHAVERRLAALLEAVRGRPVDPLDLPMLVDTELRARITTGGVERVTGR